jgi:hypothetical protein
VFQNLPAHGRKTEKNKEIALIGTIWVPVVLPCINHIVGHSSFPTEFDSLSHVTRGFKGAWKQFELKISNSIFPLLIFKMFY